MYGVDRLLAPAVGSTKIAPTRFRLRQNRQVLSLASKKFIVDACCVIPIDKSCQQRLSNGVDVHETGMLFIKSDATHRHICDDKNHVDAVEARN